MKSELMSPSLNSGRNGKMKKNIKISSNINHPLVSVIMPVFNAQEYIAEAIESILNQTYKNIEFIIVDDASTDKSWELIQKYKIKNPGRISVYKTIKKTNSAGNGAMNFGYQYSHGEFIARMDADDIAHPKRIEKQIAFMLRNPETIIVGTQAEIINAAGKIVGNKNMPITHANIYKQYAVFHPLIHPSVMINKKLLPNKKRIYEMKFDINDDYYTFFKLLNYGKFANLPEYLLKYRMHGKNLSLTNPKAKFIDSVRIRMRAVRDLNYKMTPKGMILMMLQIIIVLPIPERLIVPTYMFVRGIKKPKLISIPLPSLPNLKKYATL